MSEPLQKNANGETTVFLQPDFPYSRLGRVYYELIWEYLEYFIDEEDHLLEIGCKSGIDTMHFAEKSIKVTATDPSRNLLNQVLYKSGRRMLQEFVLPMQLDPAQPPAPHEFLLDLRVEREVWPRKCDAAFCNFGMLNEISGQQRFAEFLWKVLDKDALFVAVVKNRFCLRDAFIRLKRKEYKRIFERVTPVLPEINEEVESNLKWYPTPEELIALYQPYFELTAVKALGFALPPASQSLEYESSASDFEKLKNLEVQYSDSKIASNCSDFYMIVMRRRSWSKEKES